MTEERVEHGVTIVGSSFMDLVHRVNKLPAIGETIFAKEYIENLGGKGNNQAIMVAKLTRTSCQHHPKCLFVTGIGSDGFAQSMMHSFNTHLHNTSTIAQFDNVSTGRAMINVDDQGRNNIVLLRGANEKLQIEHVDRSWKLIQQHTRVLVVQNEIPFDTTAHTLKRGHDNGMLTVFNTAPAPSASLLTCDVMKYVDILCPNETEAIAILGESEASEEFIHKHELTVEDGMKIAKILYDKYSDECPNIQIVITLGEKGAVAYMNSEFSLDGKRSKNLGERVMNHFPLQEKKVVVDTTGAGDAFVGSLAYYLSCGISLNCAIPLSNIVASDTVTRFGSQASFSDQF